jgi:hypothetical protein
MSQHRMPSTVPVFLCEAFGEKRRQGVQLALGHMPVDVLEHVLDVNLGSRALAEKNGTFVADDRSRGEQQPLRPCAETG